MRRWDDDHGAQGAFDPRVPVCRRCQEAGHQDPRRYRPLETGELCHAPTHHARKYHPSPGIDPDAERALVRIGYGCLACGVGAVLLILATALAGWLVG